MSRLKPPASREELATMYGRGMSLSEIGRQLGSPCQTIKNWMDRFGIKTNPKLRKCRSPWDDRKEEIEYLYYVQDMSQKQIAEYFGADQSYIYVLMKRMGFKSLGRGRRKGAGHYKFKDGKWNRDYRKVIDKDKCRLCGATENLGIHHRNDDHYDNRIENLEVLCNSCHMSETKRKWWAAKKAGEPTPKSNGPVGWGRKGTPPA